MAKSRRTKKTRAGPQVRRSSRLKQQLLPEDIPDPAPVLRRSGRRPARHILPEDLPEPDQNPPKRQRGVARVITPVTPPEQTSSPEEVLPLRLRRPTQASPTPRGRLARIERLKLEKRDRSQSPRRRRRQHVQPKLRPKASPTLRTTHNAYVDYEMLARSTVKDRKKVMTDSNRRWKLWRQDELDELDKHFTQLKTQQDNLQRCARGYDRIMEAEHAIMVILSKSGTLSHLNEDEQGELGRRLASWLPRDDPDRINTDTDLTERAIRLVPRLRAEVHEMAARLWNALHLLRLEQTWLRNFFEQHKCPRSVIDRARSEEWNTYGKVQHLKTAVDLMLDEGADQAADDLAPRSRLVRAGQAIIRSSVITAAIAATSIVHFALGAYLLGVGKIAYDSFENWYATRGIHDLIDHRQLYQLFRNETVVQIHDA